MSDSILGHRCMDLNRELPNDIRLWGLLNYGFNIQILRPIPIDDNIIQLFANDLFTAMYTGKRVMSTLELILSMLGPYNTEIPLLKSEEFLSKYPNGFKLSDFVPIFESCLKK